MGKESKKQHFIPKMFIKHFAFDGHHCYTLNDSNEINCQNVTEICKKKNLYELKNKDGEIVWPNFFEKKVFKPIEDEFPAFFDEMQNAINSGYSLLDNLANKEYIKALIWFMVSLLLRNRTTISQTGPAALDVGINWSEREAKNNGILHTATLQETLTQKWEDEFNIVIHINQTEEPYITSDFPFVLLPPVTNSFRFWYFPVFPNCLVILEPWTLTGERKDKEFASPLWFVQSINRFFSIQNKSLLISNDEATLIKLRDWRINNEQHNDRKTISTLHY